MKNSLIILLISIFMTSLIYASDFIKGKNDFIKGTGDFSSYNLYKEWIKAYNKNTGFKVEYIKKNSLLSIKDAKERSVDFAGTDKSLTPKRLRDHEMYQFPAVIGAIVMGYNLPGVKNLKLSREAVVEIAAGMVKFWDDKVIAESNPKIKFPHKALIFVHNSNASGTTYNFTYYLSKISKAWKMAYGARGFLNWPGEQHVSGKTNSDIAALIKKVPYSIGYLDYVNAKNNDIVMASLENKNGRPIKPSFESFQSAVSKIKFNPKRDFHSIVVDPSGNKSYPIITTSFVIVPSKKPMVNKDITKFYDWCYTHGQEIAKNSGFVPLPQNLITQIKTYWNSKGI